MQISNSAHSEKMVRPDVGTNGGDRTFWESAAESRWGRYLTEIEQRSIMAGSELAPKPGFAVEIGCEGGRWSQVLANDGWDLICTDVREDVLGICQRRIPSAKCIRVHPADETIPCASGAAGIVVCMEVAPVTSSAWFAAEAFRVLKDGGILVATTTNQLSHRGLLRKLAGSRDIEPGLYSQSYRKWRNAFSEAGFTFISEYGYCWPLFTRRSDSRLVPFFVGLEQRLRLGALPGVSPWIVVVARKGVDPSYK